MAMPKRCVEILRELAKLSKERMEIKEKARVLRDEHDMILKKATLQHKLGSFSEADKEALREMLK